MPKASWFEVDKDGLSEMFANFPPERMVAELVQNAWDCDKSKECKVVITPQSGSGLKHTTVTVVDDNPDGFRDLRDAYTLFGSTDKRVDPTKRGRFNLGEKIVLARAVEGLVATTTGAITFGKDGRKNAPSLKTKTGSVVTITFKKWTDKQVSTTLDFLQKLYVPQDIHFMVQGSTINYQPPMKTAKAKLATEFLKSDGQGNTVMTKTTRVTELWFYPKRFEKAHLYELGLPICEIEGRFDVNVQQKVPLSHDRTLVSQAYLQDIYAEMLMALGDLVEPGDIGATHVRMAMEDERIDSGTCARLFKQEYGANAVLANPFDADSNQAAVRAGVTLVPPKTFGAEINSKLREAGVRTSTESYCQDKVAMMVGAVGLPEGYKEVKNETPEMENLRKYTQTLAARLYSNKIVRVSFANWMSQIGAIYEHGSGITFNTFRISKADMAKPVSALTSIVVHELSHTMGAHSHDGIYDHEYESNVNKLVILMLRQPELFQEFEPELFDG